MNKNFNIDCNKVVKTYLKKINRKNLLSYDFLKKEEFKHIQRDFFENLNFDLFPIMEKYIDLIIEYILEIIYQDCVNIFSKGLLKGIEFEKYLKNKYEKSEQ